MSVSVFFSPLQSLINTLQSEKHYRDGKKDEALNAINKALIETKRYIEMSKGVDRFDRGQEFNLAQLWADAATKARYASNELAVRLQDKSLYWTDDLKWSREEVLSRHIDIGSLQDQVSDLLK